MIGSGTVEVVANVVFARPDDFYWGFCRARNERCFDSVVLNEAAAKSTADEGDVNFDALLGNGKGLRDGGGSGIRNLCGRPEFAFAIADVRGAIDGFHGGMGQEGNFISSFDGLGGTRVGRVEIAVVSHDRAGFGNQLDHMLAKSGGAFANDIRLVPFDLEALASLHCGPGGISDDSHTGATVIPAAGTGRFTELMSHVNRRNFEDAPDTGKRFHFTGIETARSTSVGGTAFHGCDQHSGNARIYTEFRGAVDFS